MFHHDAQHTGRSPFTGPSVPELKWAYATGSGIFNSSPAIGADGTIYIGSDDNNLYALNPSDGSLKWKYPTKSEVFSSPAIGTDGTIYVGSWDDHLYALNPNGSLKWTFAAGYQINSSPVIGADGTIYVGSSDSTFYALRLTRRTGR
jgi:outer membrane protein assembly factor BamB